MTVKYINILNDYETMFFDLGENNATFKTNIMQKFEWFLVNNRFSLSVLLKGVLLG